MFMCSMSNCKASTVSENNKKEQITPRLRYYRVINMQFMHPLISSLHCYKINAGLSSINSSLGKINDVYRK